VTALRPYHAFELDGQHYVYSVAGVSFRAVSAPIVAELARLSEGAASEVGPEARAVIGDLALDWSESVRSVADLAERDRKAVARVREHPPPITRVELLVTQECTMACPYCYGVGGGYGSGGMMSEATAMAAINWLLERAGPSEEVAISCFGGEPLLNFPLIREVVPTFRERTRGRGKSTVSITTNLTLLDQRILDFFVANDVDVVVSCDGPPEIQNRNRPLKSGGDSYASVAPKIRMLLAARPRSLARATLAPGDDPVLVAAELRSLGFTRLQIEPASGRLLDPSESGAQVRQPDPLAEARLSEARSFRDALRRRDAARVRELADSRDVRLGLELFLDDSDLYRKVTRPRRLFFCARALTMAAVAVNGDLYPCHRFVGAPGFRMGNVHGGEPNRGDFLRSPIVETEVCRSCWARYACGGNCQFESAAASGDPMRPDPASCQARKARLEGAIHAVAGIDSECRSWLAWLGVVPERRCVLDPDG
jgi:uncharacterized protein